MGLYHPARRSPPPLGPRVLFVPIFGTTVPEIGTLDRRLRQAYSLNCAPNEY